MTYDYYNAIFTITIYYLLSQAYQFNRSEVAV